MPGEIQDRQLGRIEGEAGQRCFDVAVGYAELGVREIQEVVQVGGVALPVEIAELSSVVERDPHGVAVLNFADERGLGRFALTFGAPEGCGRQREGRKRLAALDPAGFWPAGWSP